MPQYKIDIGGELFLVTVEGDTLKSVNGKPASARLTAESGTHRFVLAFDDRAYRFVAVKSGERYEVAGGGITLDLSVKGEHAERARGLGHQADVGTAIDLRAPMPALVRAVNVKEGETVAEGQILVVLEAMKMENDVHASRSGRVGKIAVSAGMTVEKNQLLLILE